MTKTKNIYLSAIHQNAGKTTFALGLYKSIRERGLKAAFMKPVGQQFVMTNRLRIDKDSYLIGEIYHCWQNFKAMSPVIVPRGFTEKYIFHPQRNKLRKQIMKSYKLLSRGKDVVIIEGTGHAGVGSVIDFSNADVASILGSKVIIISEGGIGKAIDEIMLNKALFDLRGIETLGAIVNKVLPEKYERVKRSVARGLKNKGIRLLGVIPLDPILSSPTVEQIMKELGLKLLSGKKNLSNHVENTIVAAMEPHNMVSYLKKGTLVITSGDRNDNIIASINVRFVSKGRKVCVAGIILTGGLLPNQGVLALLKKSSIPVLLSEDDTYKVAAQIESLTCKIEKADKDKIKEATWLVKKYVDMNTIIKSLNL